MSMRHATSAPVTQPDPSFLPGTSPMPAQAQMAHGQPPSFDDALSYINQIWSCFKNQPDVYKRFLVILEEFNDQANDIPATIKRVSNLFNGHPALIQGFSTFLPDGYRIECGTDENPDAIRVTTPNGTVSRSLQTRSEAVFEPLVTGPNDHGPETPSSSSSTVVVSPAAWKDPAFLKQTPPKISKQSYLDVPAFRPSLDSTFSDLSELSVHAHELRTRHPLIRSISRDAATSTAPGRRPPSRFRAAWDDFIDINYGAILVLSSQGFGTGMNISARLLEIPGSHGEPMHPFQILFVRQSITALICTVWGMYNNSIPNFPFGVRGMRWLLVLRGVAGFFGVFGMYFSLLYLPLSEATVLGFLSPVLSCYLCSFIIPGETFSMQQQIAGFVSLIGVLFIARPASLLSLSSPSTQPAAGNISSSANSTTPVGAVPEVTQQQHLTAVGIAMLGVVGATFAITAIRIIGTKVHAFISINYFSVFCSLVSLACLIIFPGVKFRLPGNLAEWGWLTLLGSCGFIMQFLLTAGLAYGGPSPEDSDQKVIRTGHKHNDLEDSTSVHPTHTRPKRKASGTRATAMCYTQMLFALAGDKLVFGTTPDTMSWIGSVLILAGAVWVAAARDTVTQDKKKTRRQRSTDTYNGQTAFSLLRRSGTTKDDGVTHEESVGLMNDQHDGDAPDEDHDDDATYEIGRRDEADATMFESVEMHDLQPHASGS